MIQTIHPFPARMASELALATLEQLRPGSTVLDPMSGSGTVLRQASELGYQAIGFDLDPLAVLMSRAWTTPVSDGAIRDLASSVLSEARALDARSILLPWIDNDLETDNFVNYWFAAKQKNALRRIAFVLHKLNKKKLRKEKSDAVSVLRVALSRIVITKDQGASLARDVSHSRPHRVAVESDYDVFDGFEKSVKQVRRRLSESPPKAAATVNIGDARLLRRVHSQSIDAVLTSPPYLNAIDYMRGHRMSLVWLGHSLSELRSIRATSIGAERGPETLSRERQLAAIRAGMGQLDALSTRHLGMINRYVYDLDRLFSETARVLKRGGIATFVVGDSCLKGVFIKNSGAVQTAAETNNLKLIERRERELPTQSRYLPTPTAGSLAKRMRTEVVLQFSKH